MWNTFAYLSFIFQSSGFSDAQPAVLIASFCFGCTLGPQIGGVIADMLNNIWPNGGYIITAQISAALHFPLLGLCLQVIPKEHAYYVHLIFSLFITGLLITWCNVADKCLFTEISRPETRNAIFALNYCIQGTISALTIPAVALLSKTTSHGDQAQVLSANIVAITAFVTFFLVFAYGCLHQTHRTERFGPTPYLPVSTTKH
mmetsp:Transcript_28801/g.46590  ORF Transcript_28801/g.46590 Transcript_28801/m.46590 type:complete len:202 (-) Transcript_28801:342-947(-)